MARIGSPLTVEGDASPLPAGIDLTAYRLVQEGLTNALKHSRATHAEVRVRYAPGPLKPLLFLLGLVLLGLEIFVLPGFGVCVDQGIASVADAAQLAAEDAEPQGDLNASPEYRVHLAKVLVRRALEAC